MSSTRKITLKSSDGETFEIDEVVAMESQTIKHVIEAGCVDDAGIPLLQVTRNILAKVIEYCKKHVEATSFEEKPSEDALNAWDTEFLKVDPYTLMKLTLAANYLNIKSLYDLTCKTIADMMKNKPPEEIRKTFNIVNDYTPEEEAEVRQEHYQAFQWL